MLTKNNSKKFFFIFLATHLFVWTLIPSLSNLNCKFCPLSWGALKGSVIFCIYVNGTCPVHRIFLGLINLMIFSTKGQHNRKAGFIGSWTSSKVNGQNERFKKPGFISAFFLIIYSFFRFIMEFFRAPDYQIGYLAYQLTFGQIISIVFFFLGIFLYLLKRNED